MRTAVLGFTTGYARSMGADERVRSFDAAARAALADLRSNVQVIDVATSPFLSPDECDEIIAACDPDGWYLATRSGYSSADALAGQEPVRYIDPEKKSRIEQHLPGGASGPLAVRIAEQVLAVNDEVFQFRTIGLEDPTRVLCYRGAHADRVHEHIDLGPLHPLRKLGFSILLSSPDTFEGGDLQFSGTTFERARTQGTLTMFPSFVPHLVTPTTGGVRYVIVGWVLGPTFV